MPLCYAKNKKHILKWRENNLDKSREINRLSSNRAYHYNKEHPEEHVFNKECRRFRNIKV